MSYILDALRKSEARRRMGEAPGLDDAHPAAASGSSGRRIRPFMMVAIAALAVIGVASILFLNRDLIGERLAGSGSQPTPTPAEQPIEPVLPLAMDEDEPQRGQSRILQDRPYQVPAAERDRPGPDGRERERVVSDPDEIEAELARRVAEQEHETAVARQQERQDQEDTGQESRRVRTAPQTSVSAPAPRRRDQPSPEQIARSEEIERRLREIEERHRREADAEIAQTPDEPAPEAPEKPSPSEDDWVDTEEPVEVAMATAPQPAAEPWSPGGPEYVRVWELPLSIRRDLPDLQLTIHVYSRDEQRRFVLVNGQRFTTGDTISSGVRLAAIRPEGAVIDYRNYRFLLEP